MTVQGTVQSHTVIRVPDKAHAAVARSCCCWSNSRMASGCSGISTGAEPPAIGSRVTAEPSEQTLVFRRGSDMKLEPITRANRPDAKKS